MPENKLPDTTSPSARKSISILRRLLPEIGGTTSIIQDLDNQDPTESQAEGHVVEPSSGEILTPKNVPGRIEKLTSIMQPEVLPENKSTVDNPTVVHEQTETSPASEPNVVNLKDFSKNPSGTGHSFVTNRQLKKAA